AATSSASALPSATISTSLGPAIESMSTWPKQRRFAVATQTLPGPTILSTRGMLLVPKASAAIACAPPTRYTASTPATWQAASTTGVSPSGPTGDTAITSPTPATRAGITVISTVDG